MKSIMLVVVVMLNGCGVEDDFTIEETNNYSLMNTRCGVIRSIKFMDPYHKCPFMPGGFLRDSLNKVAKMSCNRGEEYFGVPLNWNQRTGCDGWPTDSKWKLFAPWADEAPQICRFDWTTMEKITNISVSCERTDITRTETTITTSTCYLRFSW